MSLQLSTIVSSLEESKAKLEYQVLHLTKAIKAQDAKLAQQ